MKKLIHNERGVTLIELLGAMVVLAIVMVLIANVQIFGQKQFVNQTEQVSHEADVRLAMNLLTKEIRSASSISVTNNTIQTDTGKIELKGSTLQKGSKVIGENIASFSASQKDGKVTLTLKSKANENKKASSLSTTLYIRK
ncbi:PilW family protein [Rossellomorea marisflavi]|uniref:PilW family protein n=1 Tax=Rossellomorea marisflavi TaxID=189381 RepID=UPI001C4607AE|nr:prepilin-type N-terminal cleavage/methylation domain-containing protein [Bacillus sp. JRC01]